MKHYVNAGQLQTFFITLALASVKFSQCFTSNIHPINFNLAQFSHFQRQAPCAIKFRTVSRLPITCTQVQKEDGSEPSVIASQPLIFRDIEATDLNGKSSTIKLTNETMSRLQAKFGISRLAPVQTATFSAILGGKDVLVRSYTGSGKTLAFCLPLVEILRLVAAKQIARQGPANQPVNPRILILLPTRELALQVARVFRTLAGSSFRCVAAVGGTALDPQVLLRPIPPLMHCPRACAGGACIADAHTCTLHAHMRASARIRSHAHMHRVRDPPARHNAGAGAGHGAAGRRGRGGRHAGPRGGPRAVQGAPPGRGARPGARRGRSGPPPHVPRITSSGLRESQACERPLRAAAAA
jgi:hypothetical protein